MRLRGHAKNLSWVWVFKALLGSDPELSTMQPDPEKPGQRDMEDLLLAVLPKCKLPVSWRKVAYFTARQPVLNLELLMHNLRRNLERKNRSRW